MAAEVVTPRTPFFHSDLPTFMGALAQPRLFHTDRYGDHLYEFKPEGRYEFAESVQNALSKTGSLNGWDQFVLLIYSLISTAWYAQKINSIYQDKSENGDNADFNERLYNIMKGINEDRTVSGAFSLPSSIFTESEPAEREVRTPEEIRASVSSPKSEYPLSSRQKVRIRALNNLTENVSVARLRLAKELGMHYKDLQRELNAWNAELPESIKYAPFGETLYLFEGFPAFQLFSRLAEVKGVGRPEIQAGFKKFVANESRI